MRKSVILVSFIVFMLYPVSPCFADSAADWLAEQEIDLYGFIDLRAGAWLGDGLQEKDISLAELRMQLNIGRDFDWGSVKFKGDLVPDAVTEEVRGELRELYLFFSPLDFLDVKLGRQVLTWGTGDLLFINDLFPKDWQSFFIGRDNDYLKLPNDALKASFFSEFINADLVYVPVFNGSSYIDGSRLSYWNPILSRIVGSDFIFDDDKPSDFPDDGEYAARLFKNIGSVETALYFYSGFWKTPEGFDANGGRLIYPGLNEYGASLRSPVASGIGNLEAGYYDSRDDKDGVDPLVRNSEWRILAGYEQEIASDFTASVQYYLEWMQDYAAYLETAGEYARDEYRHLFTLRLTKLLLQQNLQLTMFVYYSPSDEDGYLRLTGKYKLSDQWAAVVGGNYFSGNADSTFFGQFKQSDNLYAGLSWTF